MIYREICPDNTKLQVLESEEDSGILEGYASVFGNVDLSGDVVEKGAFKKTLETIRKGYVKLFDSHLIFEGTEAIIGVVTEAEEDDHGLKFKAKFSSTQRAQNIRTKIKEGILNALSFGFDVLKAAPDPKNEKIRHLTELKLYEVSVVAWGMNPKAMIEAVKTAKIDQNNGEPLSPAQASPEEIAAFLRSLKSDVATLSLRQMIRDMRQLSEEMSQTNSNR